MEEKIKSMDVKGEVEKGIAAQREELLKHVRDTVSLEVSGLRKDVSEHVRISVAAEVAQLLETVEQLKNDADDRNSGTNGRPQHETGQSSAAGRRPRRTGTRPDHRDISSASMLPHEKEHEIKYWEARK